MSQSQTVTINGMRYDAHSGLPLDTAPKPTQPRSPRTPHPAAGVHTTTQRSHTLNRDFIKKPTPPVAQPAASAKKPSVARSPHITKFAKDPQPIVHKKQQRQRVRDIGPIQHPVVARAAHHHTPAKPQPRPAHEIKHRAISDAMAKAHPAPTKQHKTRKPRARALNVAAASVAIVLMAGYFTYINMPSLSVRVAAAQAGISATYPQYRPAGYRLNGPVAYRDGQVSMEFASNAGPQEFALNQTKSSWDSSALLTNYVDPQSKGNYATYSDAGLTIYTYGTNAAWVNGGILYTVQGTATLSNDQVRNIATSM